MKNFEHRSNIRVTTGTHPPSTGISFRWAPQFATSALLLFFTAGTAAATPISALVLSEIMYEPTGGDNGGQWVEIYNGTGSSIDLSDYRLEWGQQTLSTAIALSGTVAANSSFVIGGPTSDVNNGNPVYDQVFNFNPNLRDGAHNSREDAVALFQISTSTLMHIVVYGGDGTAVQFNDEQGATAIALDVTGLGQGDTLEYLGSDSWQVQGVTTPGAPHSSLVPIPEPTPAVMIGLGLLAMGRLRQSDTFCGDYAWARAT
jgi:hypothetical protein